MSFEYKNFKTKPNFRFQEYVTEKSDCLCSTYQFDCYENKKGEIILISPFFDIDNILDNIHYISLINLKDNKEIKKLEGHKDRIVNLRYFQNPFTKNDYLISADRKFIVIVWDLTDYNIKVNIEIKYEVFIYSCLLFFDQNQMWAVTSSLGVNNYTKVIDCEDKTNIIDIEDSKDQNVYFLAYWRNNEANDENSIHNIIQCSKKKLFISQFPGNTTYFTLETTDKYLYLLGGIVFQNKGKDVFVFSSSFGLIQVLELVTKTIVKSIEFDKVQLYSFVKWNDRYLLINDCFQKRIIVMDIKDDFKIYSKVLCPQMHFDRFIKKVYHPLYGESILSIGTDWKIKLFVNRSVNPNIRLKINWKMI